MKTRILAGLALLALAGCSDSTGPSLPNFEGHYVVGGLVNGFPQADITGSISITNQSGDEATVVQTFNFRENGETFVTLFTESPAVAELSPERSISWFFTIEGTTFSASGQLQGNTITGNWNWTGSGESLVGDLDGEALLVELCLDGGLVLVPGLEERHPGAGGVVP